MLPQTLKLFRQFHHIKQKEMAAILNISPAHLSEIESGKNTISLDLLNKYANYFDVKLSQILLFSEELENEGTYTRKARVYLAGKILKILEWKIENGKKKEKKEIKNNSV